MGLASWEFIQGPLAGCQTWLSISFGSIGILFMEDCAPSTFLGK